MKEKKMKKKKSHDNDEEDPVHRNQLIDSVKTAVNKDKTIIYGGCTGKVQVCFYQHGII